MRDWIPLVVAACALIAALANMRGTIRQARAGEDANQIQWLREAKSEAEAAKREADETRDESAETKRELARTRREVVELRDLVEELTRWTMRVVAWKDDPDMGLDELRRLINGGPPSLRQITPRPDGGMRG